MIERGWVSKCHRAEGSSHGSGYDEITFFGYQPEPPRAATFCT